jgi:uncharacterized membrane protein YkoI
MNRFVALFAAALITAALPAAADAQGRAPRGERSEQQKRGGENDRQAEREIPLSQLIRMVESRTGGEYVNANPRMQGGRKYYWMRLRFPGGRFQDYMVDASTGQF